MSEAVTGSYEDTISVLEAELTVERIFAGLTDDQGADASHACD